MTEWISVKDRLPELNTDCLIYMESRGMLIGWFGLYDKEVQFIPYTPTHWIPLPEKPKSDLKEQQ